MKLTVRETVLFGMLGALMYASMLVMQALPNIHLLGMFIVAITVVYRKKALYPIYTFVLITGLLSGFALWWVPYLYIWLPLWGAVMLLPQRMSPRVATVVYMTVSGLHGLLFGLLYAPAQALLFGLDWNGMVAWLLTGFPYDAIHGVSNFCFGLLIPTVIKVLQDSQRHAGRN